MNRKEAVDLLWERGVLTWKLHPIQQEIYDTINNSEEQLIVITCSRRIGKTYLMCEMATEICIKKPGAIVKFIAPEQKQIKKIIKPLMQEITADCPNHLRPEYKTNDNLYLFPNGSEIQLAGTDNGNHESLRGGRADLCIVDEAGFCDDLQYVINSVLLPTTLTTKGKVILVSTPSKSTDHQFITEYVKPYEFHEKLIKKTIYDNPLITLEDIQRIIRAYPEGEKSTEFRREYLCEIVTESDSAVIPEFTEELQKDIVKEWQKPPFYDAYTSMDIGFKDLTVVLFSYFDFKNNKVIIEDELVINGPTMTTEKLAELILEKERQLWKNSITNEAQKVYRRICDNNLILINDLSRLHKLDFEATKKDNADAALNNLRMYLAQRKVLINPRCKTTIKHLKGATWNKARDNYLRSPDGAHYDALDAASYLMRNIVWSRNPYPANYGISGDDWFFSQKNLQDSAVVKEFKKMFKLKS